MSLKDREPLLPKKRGVVTISCRPDSTWVMCRYVRRYECQCHRALSGSAPSASSRNNYQGRRAKEKGQDTLPPTTLQDKPIVNSRALRNLHDSAESGRNHSLLGDDPGKPNGERGEACIGCSRTSWRLSNESPTKSVWRFAETSSATTLLFSQSQSSNSSNPR